jgi:hypothetical protein
VVRGPGVRVEPARPLPPCPPVPPVGTIKGGPTEDRAVRRALPLLAGMALGFAPAPPPRDTPKADLARLQGEWVRANFTIGESVRADGAASVVQCQWSEIPFSALRTTRLALYWDTIRPNYSPVRIAESKDIDTAQCFSIPRVVVCGAYPCEV